MYESSVDSVLNTLEGSLSASLAAPHICAALQPFTLSAAFTLLEVSSFV